MRFAYADVRQTDAINGTELIGLTVEHDSPDIIAEYAAICTEDGMMLWERDVHTAVPMASITKIMTALTAVDSVDLETEMTVSSNAAAVGGSTAELRAGYTTTLQTLLYGLMIPSGNDAAVAIAENIAGDEQSYVELMNQKATELGLESTHFSNVSGIEDTDNYTTVSDCLKLTRVAMSDLTFRQIVKTQETTVTIGGVETVYTSTNLLLETMEGATGVKTGFTDAAGYCLVGSAYRNGIELYAVILRSSDEQSRFDDATTLLNWGFEHYRPVELINAAVPVGTVALTDWIDKSVEVFASGPVIVDLFDYDGTITQEVQLSDHEGSISKGESVGSIVWSQGGEVVASIDIVAARDVAKPDFLQGLGIAWERFWGGFKDQPPHEESQIYLPREFSVPDPLAES
ncbi:MAG: D-alanyl-D-alanine carboxypeptidase [Coriobacteriaceae bacterium]|nr:D-alanyl-D-alanine carboxypeptidase [Coriobacteriaceae bacterium]